MVCVASHWFHDPIQPVDTKGIQVGFKRKKGRNGGRGGEKEMMLPNFKKPLFVRRGIREERKAPLK